MFINLGLFCTCKILHFIIGKSFVGCTAVPWYHIVGDWGGCGSPTAPNGTRESQFSHNDPNDGRGLHGGLQGGVDGGFNLIDYTRRSPYSPSSFVASSSLSRPFSSLVLPFQFAYMYRRIKVKGKHTATVPRARNSSVGGRMPRDVRLGPRSRLPKHMVPGKYPRALLQ